MTTPRPLAWTRRAAAPLLLAFGLTALAGCDPRPLFYFLQPWEPTIPASGPSLKGKKVVVLASALAASQGEFISLDRELTRELVMILREKVKKIQIVDPDKVWTWVEGHPSWTDPSELAREFEADMVVFLEVSTFQIQSPNSPMLLEGTSKVDIKVTELAHPKNTKGKPILDQPKEAETIYTATRDTIFPIRGPIPIDSGVSRQAFKDKFLKLVAAELSWHFVEHAPGDDIQDVKFNNNR